MFFYIERGDIKKKMSENQKEDRLFKTSVCEKGGMEICKCGEYCYTPTESCIHTRRCFMSGEYCSQQSNIQREREKLYAEDSIRAFVIMNFSDMSDVVYEWRIKSFVEALSSYLYFDKENQRLYCSSVADDNNCNKDKMVKNIEVSRSDSAPASNYVVCNRICQQLQIADLVIVDVSSQNANVFYEFGMAVALGKMILPICYSESFYKMAIPEKLKDRYWKLKDTEEVAHHIGLFPWRKDLFEYYGIRYKAGMSGRAGVREQGKPDNKKNKTHYVAFETATDPENGFSDVKYGRFPYHEIVPESGDKNKQTIGWEIYDKLSNNYNDAKPTDNTLVVYTMDSFLNKEQAGQCIVNFYRSITARMDQEKCFCGERVGVLVQENVIPESEKDAKEHIDILYNIGEIIQIGTNQATYLAAEEKIYSNDDFSKLEEIGQENTTEQGEGQRRNIERFVREHSKNRAMRIYPNNPVFVDRLKNLLHKDILETGVLDAGQADNCCNLDSFCLYHVMLRTLRYTNEVVVDVSDNCLQSLFWLGAAHGSDIYAITVIHEKTDMEKNYTEGADIEKEQNVNKKENRNVFDVSGLWMAILKKNDTGGFYQQLASVQRGIEQRSKLMLANNNNEFYKQEVKELLFPGSNTTLCENKPKEAFKKLLHQKVKDEREKMESYYRERFWKPLLSYNQLCIYLSQMNEKGQDDQEPRLCMSKWDYDAVAVFSNYLSKRKLIGEYYLVSLPRGRAKTETELDPRKINYVCVGSESQPLGEGLPEYISEQIKSASSEYNGIPGINVVHKKWTTPPPPTKAEDKICREEDRVYKGFERIGDTEKVILTHYPKTQKCINCTLLEKNGSCSQISATKPLHSKEEILEKACYLKKDGMHCEVAQLILWREEPQNSHDRDYFWVGIAGSSGPATEALSMLFVTKEQRKFEKDNENCLLYNLQKSIRMKVMKIFFMKLRNKLEEIELKFCDEMGEETTPAGEDQKRRYCALVEHAVSSYLSTVFYRYFFPLLSKKDIDRICNGMYMFVNSMKAAKISPFAIDYHSDRDREYSSFVTNESIEEIVNEIPKVLYATLKSFRGVEVFYNVTVHHCLEKNDENEDTRKIVSIKRLRDDKFSNLNCFFV